MDSFEHIIANLFTRRGYWTRLNYKVNLLKEEKRAIGKHSMPRPELDILAYRPQNNVVLWVECKSYLDSTGVPADAFDGTNSSAASRYKIFTDELYRQIASDRLLQQLLDEGLVLPGVSIQHCLVAGKVKSGCRDAIFTHFHNQGWLFYDDNWIRSELEKLATLGYENDVAVMVAKLFVRNS